VFNYIQFYSPKAIRPTVNLSLSKLDYFHCTIKWSSLPKEILNLAIVCNDITLLL
jgi:hypothetical protein